MKSLIRDILQIYISGAKVGLMTFGGGYAMLPILEREVVDRRKWNTKEDILDYYALSQCLPGLIMSNTLAFVGQKRRGRIGAAAGTLGAITPALIIITIIASLLTTFADLKLVQNAFAGIRVCVCVLIFNSIVSLWKSSIVDMVCLGIFACVLAGSFIFKVSPVVFVILSAVAGIAMTFRRRAK